MPYTPDPNLLPLTEAARFIRCCPRTVRQLVNEGRLPQPDEYSRFKRSDLEAFKRREGYDRK